MDKKNKTIVWLVIFIMMILISAAVATYAYYNFQTKVSGSFDVDVTSKGVDILAFNPGKDAYIEATADNFSRYFGHDLTASTNMQVKLETTNRSASFCYEVYVNLPDEEVFVYSQKGRPELLLTVQKSTNNRKYETVINKWDITTKTGQIKVPVEYGEKEYLNIISTTKRRNVYQYWKASITLVWFEDADQEINDQKTYSATLETKLVDC